MACPNHQDLDSDRRCEATAQGGVRCHAWPLRGKAHCAAHDPEAKALRRAAAQAKAATLREEAAQLRVLHALSLPVAILLFDHLVRTRRLRWEGLEAALREIGLGQSLEIPPDPALKTLIQLGAEAAVSKPLGSRKVPTR